MSKAKPKIVFFGSGPVAAESLKRLTKYVDIEAIVTKPATVKEMAAIAKGICVHSANTKAELDRLMRVSEFESELAILIDFGIIVSRYVLDSFKYGIINSHFSLLPQLRGADPISFSILSGQKKTGVSLMVVDIGMDTGKIITQKSLMVADDETAPSLTEKLLTLSDDLLKVYIPRYIVGDVSARSQPHPDRATYSRKLTKEDGILDFAKPAHILEREVRAYIEWPKSRTEIAGKDVVIMESSVNMDIHEKPGAIYKTSDKKIIVATAEGALVITQLKPAGKNAMTSEAFLAGYGSTIPKITE